MTLFLSFALSGPISKMNAFGSDGVKSIVCPYQLSSNHFIYIYIYTLYRPKHSLFIPHFSSSIMRKYIELFRKFDKVFKQTYFLKKIKHLVMIFL
jgi:hypothetical protein